MQEHDVVTDSRTSSPARNIDVTRISFLKSAAMVFLVILAAAGIGLVATMQVQVAAIAGMGLLAAVVVLAGSMTRRPTLFARVLLWGGLLFSLGFRGPRRTAVDVVSQPLTLDNTLPVAVLLVTVAGALFLTRVKIFPLNRVERFGGLFVAAAGLSAVWSVAPKYSFLRCGALFIGYVAIMLLRRITRADGADLLSDLAAATYLLLFTTIAGFFLFHADAMAPIPGAVILIQRLKGVYPYIHPNALAYLAALAVVFACGGVGPRPVVSRMWVRTTLVALAIGVILASRTRSALIYLVLAGALAVLLNRRLRDRAILMVPAFLAVVFVVVQLFGGSVLGFVARDQDTQQFGTLTGRLTEWETAVAVAHARPIEGYGYYAGHRFGPLATVEGDASATTDNAWIDVLIDLGIVGFVLMAAFVASGGAELLGNYRRGSPAAVPALIAFSISLAASMVNPSLNEVTYWMLAFVIILIGAPDSRTRPDPQTNRGLRAATT